MIGKSLMVIDFSKYNLSRYVFCAFTYVVLRKIYFTIFMYGKLIKAGIL